MEGRVKALRGVRIFNMLLGVGSSPDWKVNLIADFTNRYVVDVFRCFLMFPALFL